MKKLSEIIKDELSVFSKPVEISDGVFCDWHNIVKRIKFYKQDKFLQRDDDAVFWNVVSPEIPHFDKNINLDIKDFKPVGYGDAKYYQSWVLSRKLNDWAKDSYLSSVLNETSTGLSEFGFHIIKKTYDDEGETILESTDLSNIYFDITAKKLCDSPVIEIHNLTKFDLLSKKDIWDNVDKALEVAKKEAAKENGTPTTTKYKVYERVGLFEKTEGKPKKLHTISVGEGDGEVIMFEEEVKEKDDIYFEFTLGNADNRLPGIGCYERSFKVQERANTLVNENAETTAIASLLLLRTVDSSTTGNVLNGAVSGQIINSPDLQQIVLQNPGLTNFFNEMTLIVNQVRSLCMTPEVVTGDNLPSSTPFRSLATMSNAAKSAFKKIRDNYGNKMAYVLIEHILPDMSRKWNKGDIIDLAEDDDFIPLYDNAVMKKLDTFYRENGIEKDITDLKQEVETKAKLEGRKLEIEKNFFNFEFGIEIDPVGEIHDRQQQNDTFFNVLSMIQANPAITQNKIFRQYCENNGISPIKLSVPEMATIQQGQQGAMPPMQGGDKLMNMVDSN